jgi:hypothetical protein
MRQHLQKHPHIARTIVWTAFALLTLSALTGCSRAPLTATADSGLLTQSERDAAPAPAGLIETVIDSTKLVPAPRPGSGDVVNWTLVTATPVRAGVERVVSGGRYHLHFDKNSLESDTEITIQQYDPNVLDVQFGPHGTQFKTPVELSIDFAGTLADPGRDRSPEREPVFWYLDESKNRWVVIPSVTDWENKRIIVRLEHFSRYAVGGKAGWKQQPRTESDQND